MILHTLQHPASARNGRLYVAAIRRLVCHLRSANNLSLTRLKGIVVETMDSCADGFHNGRRTPVSNAHDLPNHGSMPLYLELIHLAVVELDRIII